MPYITPSTTPDATVRRCLFIPDDPLWLAAVSGALTELIYAYNWEDIDGITAEQASQRAGLMVEQYYSGNCDMVGEIKVFATLEAVPSYCLAMDGSTYALADYPALAAVLPDAWISGDDFTLPDMHKRSVIGIEEGATGFNVYGVTGGQQRHLLTTTEIPSHVHNLAAGVVRAAAFGTGTLTAGAAGTSEVYSNQETHNTSAAGGGSDHNNMPPFIIVQFAIVAL